MIMGLYIECNLIHVTIVTYRYLNPIHTKIGGYIDPISYRLIECITFTYFVMHAGHCTTTGMLLGSLVVAKRAGNIQSMKWHA